MKRFVYSVILLPILSLLLSGCGKMSAFGLGSNVFNVSYDSQDACGFVQNVYGQRISWKNKTPIQLQVHESFPPENYPALQAAIKDWEMAIGKPLFQITQYGVGGPLTPRQDGTSVIYYMKTWEADRTSEQARTSVYWVGNEIKEADIRINALDFTFYLTNSVSNRDVNLESLLVHELGHVLGLKHNDTGGSVMATYLSAVTVRNQIGSVDLKSVGCEY